MNFAKVVFEVSTPVGKGITVCYAELYSGTFGGIVQKTTRDESMGRAPPTLGFMFIPVRRCVMHFSALKICLQQAYTGFCLISLNLI